MRQIILASASPRRKELLELMGLTFTIVMSDFDEWLDDTLDTSNVAMALGLGKARTVAAQYPDAIVIGSDTIVTVDGKQLGKAADDDEARAMLRLLSEHPSTVTTSVAVICVAEGYENVATDTAEVIFRPYNETEVEKYIATQDYRDKAGAYGIQSGAAPLIDHIAGEPTVIIGLPIPLVAAELNKFGIDTKPVDYPLPGIVVQ
jgi:septum formation protein